MFSFCFLLLLVPLNGQVDFRKGYVKENPAPLKSGLPTEERLVIHQDWLTNAESKKDTLLRIYGEIYVFYDYIRLQDYTTATEHLLVAESLAAASGNIGWRGATSYRRGHLWVILRETDEAITAYESAASWCGTAGDSLCMAESLEQLSAMYALKDSFGIARQYFYRALPLLEKYGTKNNLQTANANFGNLLMQEGKPGKAIPYLIKARNLAEELGLKRSVGKAMNNLSNVYGHSGNTPKAIEGFLEAVRFNKEHGFTENIVQNYAGLRDSWESLGNYRMAYDYQKKFRHLRDSLIGSKTKLEIARLEENFRLAEKQLKLEATEMQRLKSQQKMERIGIVLGLMILASLIAFWLWRRQVKDNLAKMEDSKRNLNVLTRLLADKNVAIAKLKEDKRVSAGDLLSSGDEILMTAKPQPQGSGHEESANFLDQTILTVADWTEFKVQFERAHPGYLQRLRKKFPTLTDAEERLFLLLKLNLHSNEIAGILGISSGSVKKTRNRLRKKLPLVQEDGLEEFIHKF